MRLNDYIIIELKLNWYWVNVWRLISSVIISFIHGSTLSILGNISEHIKACTQALLDNAMYVTNVHFQHRMSFKNLYWLELLYADRIYFGRSVDLKDRQVVCKFNLVVFPNFLFLVYLMQKQKQKQVISRTSIFFLSSFSVMNYNQNAIGLSDIENNRHCNLFAVMKK